jgi:hypothetical protein
VDPLVPGRGSSSEDSQIVLLEEDRWIVSFDDDEEIQMVPWDDTLEFPQVWSWLELVL